MPHDHTRFDVLDLQDPIDRMIARLDVTSSQLLQRQGSSTTLDQVRLLFLKAFRPSGFGPRGILERGGGSSSSRRIRAGRRSQLGAFFPGLILPESFTGPFPFEIPEPVIPDPPTPPIEEELGLQETFGILFNEALAVEAEGTGREDLVIRR